jgi:serine/threonine protein kinase
MICLLSKRYQIQELIGTGAMGRVYRAKDILLGGVPVAVKFLNLSSQNQKIGLQERFEREAKTCALLGQRSIHIVRVMDYGLDEENTPFYVMEYLPGISLSHLIRQQYLSLPRFLSMTRQICLGLQCAHNGILIDDKIYPIIHRDIKSSNMLVIADPTFGELVKILDFGIAKLLQSNNNRTNYYLGTLAYSSPEQMQGKELDNRSDIYSLGVMMFEMLTGKLPLVAPTHSFGAWYRVHHNQKPRSFAEIDRTLQFPKPLEDLITSCLAKNPKERPESIGEILQVLTSLDQQHSRGVNVLYVTPTIQTKFEPNTHIDLLSSVSHDEIAQASCWPHNKPIADIVFPSVIRRHQELSVGLWVMLPQAEIEKRLFCTRYNQFLFITAPHPMVLWITLIYNHEHGAKWFPHYLDLKSSFGLEIARILGQTNDYRVLFFARENPHRCAHVTRSSIASTQRQRLQQWITLSNIQVPSADPQVSKNLLKVEYEKIKLSILAKLKTMDVNSSFKLCG